MPLPLASLAVTGGQTYTVSVGSRGTVGAVVIANESPYGLQVSTGSGGQWIVAQTADIVACDSTAFNGNLTIITDSYLSNASNAPSFLVYMTVYAPGEAIRGTYPAPLMRLANGGAALTVAASVVNDNNPTTNVLEATPAGSVDSYALIRNDGAVDFKAISQNVETDMLHITPGSVSAAAKLVMQLVQTLGPLSLDNGKITTDGSGNITTMGDILFHPSALGTNETILNMPGAGDFVVTVNGTVGPGNYNGFSVSVWENGTAVNLFGFGSNQTANKSYMDGSGVLHAPAPVTLAPGHQVTGFSLGGAFTATAAGQRFAYTINFPLLLTNVPSSITLTGSGTNLSGGFPATGSISTSGFLFTIQAAAAGTCNWQGTYTTVGN